MSDGVLAIAKLGCRPLAQRCRFVPLTRDVIDMISIARDIATAKLFQLLGRQTGRAQISRGAAQTMVSHSCAGNL
jgi:hypothetical protein